MDTSLDKKGGVGGGKQLLAEWQVELVQHSTDIVDQNQWGDRSWKLLLLTFEKNFERNAPET